MRTVVFATIFFLFFMNISVLAMEPSSDGSVNTHVSSWMERTILDKVRSEMLNIAIALYNPSNDCAQCLIAQKRSLLAHPQDFTSEDQEIIRFSPKHQKTEQDDTLEPWMTQTAVEKAEQESCRITQKLNLHSRPAPLIMPPLSATEFQAQKSPLLVQLEEQFKSVTPPAAQKRECLIVIQGAIENNRTLMLRLLREIQISPQPYDTKTRKMKSHLQRAREASEQLEQLKSICIDEFEQQQRVQKFERHKHQIQNSKLARTHSLVSPKENVY